jgi:hypothetical protein
MIAYLNEDEERASTDAHAAAHAFSATSDARVPAAVMRDA